MAYSVPLNTLPSLVREFASYKSVIQNASEKTISEYLLDLRTFFRFLLARDKKISPDSEEFDKIDIRGIDLDYIKNITTEDIYEFLMYADNIRGNMAAAKSRKLSSIKGFFKFLSTKRMMIEDNPAAEIESPKKKQALPKFLSLEESLELLNAVKNDKESKTTLRDYAIITLFLNCGMRVSELVGIKLTDLDPELRSMRVVGKGNKERIIYLNEACRAVLVPLIQERTSPKYETVRTRALFLSNRNEQLNTTQIYTHVSDEHMQSAMEMNPLASVAKPLPKVKKKSSDEEDEE